MLKLLIFLACVSVAYMGRRDSCPECGCPSCGQSESQLEEKLQEEKLPYPAMPDPWGTQDKRSAGLCAAKLSQVEADTAGHPRLGLETPRCDTDGSFLGMQYMGSQAYCVSKDGTPIEGYSMPRWQAGNMNCQCARDLYTYMQSGLIGKLFNCEPNGNYPPPTDSPAHKHPNKW